LINDRFTLTALIIASITLTSARRLIFTVSASIRSSSTLAFERCRFLGALDQRRSYVDRNHCRHERQERRHGRIRPFRLLAQLTAPVGYWREAQTVLPGI